MDGLARRRQQRQRIPTGANRDGHPTQTVLRRREVVLNPRLRIESFVRRVPDDADDRDPRRVCLSATRTERAALSDRIRLREVLLHKLLVHHGNPRRRRDVLLVE